MSRAKAVLIIGVLGAALFGVSMLTWVRADAATPLGAVPMQVPGIEAAPVVPTAGLAVLVAGLALGLSGRVVRYLAGGAALLAAAIALFSVIGVLTDPTSAAQTAAGEVGGVPEIDGAAQLSWWPWLAAMLAGLAGLAAAVLPFAGGVWAPVARRYERPGTAAPAPATVAGRARQDWDALSRGEDPSIDADSSQETAGDGGAEPEADLGTGTEPETDAGPSDR
ncbi:MAG TPA: Trp biosynthesis-associated membrane protein [Beutenbergiaceae bacterium]|nr:Trp biosynthesis-associated membrane protein [Beutenbergiaceae bacterium]